MGRTGQDARRWGRAGAVLTVGLAASLTASVVGCTGNVEGSLSPQDGVGGGGLDPHAGASGSGATGGTSSALELGRTGPRRLSNVEYDNTVHDLLASTQNLASNFVLEDASGFDNVANGLGMSPSQFETYEGAAESLAAELFANAARVASVLPCNPSSDDGGACLEQLLGDFGTRTFRRPLTDTDKTGLRKVYQAALGLGLAPPDARAQVLVAMLASPQFLYRVELDAATGAPASRALDGFELASRLSYFLWSSLPDAALLKVAADGSLVNTSVLQTQLTRMLADPRANTLVSNFAAQWLGLRDLGQHKVDAIAYPDFDDALRSAMVQEAQLYFDEFLTKPRPITDFLSSSLYFVNTRLAAHYGLDLKPGDTFQRVETPIGDRRGFLGLAAFLTLSSFSQRTSPTLRAKWVLEELLCSPPPPPPAGVVADLAVSDAGVAAESDNIRVRLEQHRSAPACAGCHATLDPIGLGMEGFDGIGKSRTKYDNGDAIDSTGMLPGGETFNGLTQLSAVLVNDERFPSCVAQKLLTYALGRSVTAEPMLIDATVKVSGPLTISALIENIVLSDAFRQEQPSQP